MSKPQFLCTVIATLAGTSIASGQTATQQRIINLSESAQRTVLGAAVPCAATDVLFMGFDSDKSAVWSVRCYTGATYAVAIAVRTEDSSVLECSVLKARGVRCFRTFSDQSPAPTPATSTAYKRGLAALGEDDLDAAIREFTAAIADDPNDVFPYIRRAAAYEKKGDAASAIGDYRKVLKLVDADTGAEYAAKIRKLEKPKK
jgi:Flp pilus assembly protein TadD